MEMVALRLKVSIVFAAVALVVTGFAIDTVAQKCGLSVEPRPVGFDKLIKGASATLVNKANSKLVRSVFRKGLPYFASLPVGEYRLTVKKVGYKQTAEEISHSCEDAELGISSYWISMWTGASTDIVDMADVKPVRENVKTIMGDSDFPSNVVVQSPARPNTDSPRVPKTVSGGVLNGRALTLPQPVYPESARASKADGSVTVQVLVSEVGKVISAAAVSGHPLLRQAAVDAARGATFEKVTISGIAVKVSGVITYNFVP